MAGGSALNALKPVLGLAGGIGSGKSTVAGMLAELGADVIDSDRLAREALHDPAVAERLREWWGDGICHADGTVEPARIADIVFGDASERARLEGLIHPRVAARRRERMAADQSDPNVRMIVLDSPLLFEAGLADACDVVVFVHAERELRLARVRAGRGWSEEEFTRRESLQEPLDSKRSRADYIVVSNSGLDALRQQVERLFFRVLHEGRRMP